MGAGNGFVPCRGSLPSSVTWGRGNHGHGPSWPRAPQFRHPQNQENIPAPPGSPWLPWHGLALLSWWESHGGRGGCCTLGCPEKQKLFQAASRPEQPPPWVWRPQFLPRTARGERDHPSPTDVAVSLREKGILWIGVDLDPAWWRGRCLGMASVPVAHSCSALLWIPERFLWNCILRHWQARFHTGHPKAGESPNPCSWQTDLSRISFSPASQPHGKIMEYPDQGSWSPSPNALCRDPSQKSTLLLLGQGCGAVSSPLVSCKIPFLLSPSSKGCCSRLGWNFLFFPRESTFWVIFSLFGIHLEHSCLFLWHSLLSCPSRSSGRYKTVEDPFGSALCLQCVVVYKSCISLTWRVERGGFWGKTTIFW